MFPNSFNNPTCPWKYETPVGTPFKPKNSPNKKTDITNLPTVSSKTLEIVYRMCQFDVQNLENHENYPEPLRKSFITLEVTENNHMTVIKNGTKYQKVGHIHVTDFNQITYHQTQNINSKTKEHSNYNPENVVFSVNDGTFISPKQLSDRLIAKSGTKIDIYHVLNENKRILCRPQLNKSNTKKLKLDSSVAVAKNKTIVSNKVQTLTKDATDDKTISKSAISCQNIDGASISEYLSFPKGTITIGSNRSNQVKLDRSPTYNISYIPHKEGDSEFF